MKTINSNIFELPGQTRFLHLASVTDSLKEYIYMIDCWTGKTYIEEVSGGHLELISSNKKVTEIEDFLKKEGIHASQRINLKDEVWRRNPRNPRHFLVNGFKQ